jgi:hypothetical protein
MKVVISVIFLLAVAAQAEYRVFALKIESPDGQDVRQIQSNLDPEQYVRYYPLKPNYRISYSETWMCKGRTDHKEFCANPKLNREPASAPASGPATTPQFQAPAADQSPAKP